MTDQQQHLKTLSGDTLETFQQIADKAAQNLSALPTSSTSLLVNVNTLTGYEAVNNLNAISDSNRKGYEALKSEPAISRVIVLDEGGRSSTYYISRKSQLPLDGGAKLASYHSAIGRLASLSVGDEVPLEIGGCLQNFEVVEKVRYKPKLLELGWDSLDNIFENSDFGILSIDSLRALLSEVDEEDFDALLDSILSEGTVSEGISHQARISMALRDQPILDQFQDSVFRLPLDSQLLILGPPGTGKTTTLIKRLGQKLEPEFLNDAEKSIITSSSVNELSHEQSWLMFTPTELLKQFVKEAFNREQVPASDQRIKTWDSHSLYLARSVLGILQSSALTGKFVLKNEANLLLDDIQCEPTQWFDAFSGFHRERVRTQLVTGVTLLEPLKNEKNSGVIEKISAVMHGDQDRPLTTIYRDLEALEQAIQPLLKSLKIESDLAIRKGLALAVNRDKSFLNELAKFIDALQLIDETDVDEEFDDDFIDELAPKTTSVQKAQKAYNQTIRSLARARFLKRSIPKTSKTAIILGWFQDRIPDEENLLSIGKNIASQNGLRRFMNATKRHISEVPASYREFRRLSVKQKSWYKALPVNPKYIESMELDAIVLLSLKTTRELLGQRYIEKKLDDSRNTLIKLISDQFRNQILVDEATDFSPIQLACMESLTSFRVRSFFACGDFNQRITSWGTRSTEQMKWVSNSLQHESLNIVYRQSQKLNDFSGTLLAIMGGSLSAKGELPEHMNHIGVAPALLECSSDLQSTACWVSARIQEVERSVQQMPTVAILVNTEQEVKPMASALNNFLEDVNLRAIACSDGQSLGEGTDVRVFDIQHIKGLEFEAVFFVGVDDLANQMPDLFDKYLYVGATRAATYLGLVCTNSLPQKLESLKESFTNQWDV